MHVSLEVTLCMDVCMYVCLSSMAIRIYFYFIYLFFIHSGMFTIHVFVNVVVLNIRNCSIFRKMWNIDDLIICSLYKNYYLSGVKCGWKEVIYKQTWRPWNKGFFLLFIQNKKREACGIFVVLSPSIHNIEFGTSQIQFRSGDVKQQH